jgi:hypothetical protein
VFQVQANNYATFYDDQMHNWSVMFESSGDAIEFAKEVSRAGNLQGDCAWPVCMSAEQ